MRKTKNKKIKAVDFFCGAGGMSYGLSESGIDVIAGIDIDSECKQTYEHNNPSSKFVCKDITALTPKQLLKEVDIKSNDDHLLFIGCSPCQYWTQLTTDKSKSSKNKNLLNDFLRFIKFFKPGYIVIENVPGVLKRNKESNLERFLSYLARNNYSYKYEVANANDYGVPQKRKRFLLIASRVEKDICFPQKSKKKPTVRNFLGHHNGFEKVSSGHIDMTDFMHTTARLSDKNILRLKKTPKDGGTRHAWADDPNLQIPAYVGKDNTFVDTYGRMFWDKPAPTMTTKFYSISNGRFAHPEENRGLSLREGATLQTFPKTYKFLGKTITSNARQIGNAVPPELAYRVGRHILKGHND